MTTSLWPSMQAAAAFLAEGNDFLLTSHVGSDGDGIGASLALARLLEHRGKRVEIVLPETPDARYAFLPGFSRLAAIEPRPGGLPVAWAVVLDAPRLTRTGGGAARIGADSRVLNIDHHQDNQLFGTVNLVADTVSSTCEMVYHLAVAMGVQPDVDMATALYAGLVFDTGGFRFSLTTATTLEVGAALVRCGVRLDQVADLVFGQKRLAEVQQLGLAIGTLRLYGDGRIAVMYLDHAAMAAGDPEEVVNHGLVVQGVQVSVLIREAEPGQHRVSLRSREGVDVSQVAAGFGGGGHCRAAGCRLAGAREAVVEQLLAQIEPRLPG